MARTRMLPLTMLLWVRLCLSSVRKALSSRMPWRDPDIDTPGETSASWDTNLMRLRLSYYCDWGCRKR